MSPRKEGGYGKRLRAWTSGIRLHADIDLGAGTGDAHEEKRHGGGAPGCNWWRCMNGLFRLCRRPCRGWRHSCSAETLLFQDEEKRASATSELVTSRQVSKSDHSVFRERRWFTLYAPSAGDARWSELLHNICWDVSWLYTEGNVPIWTPGSRS